MKFACPKCGALPQQHGKNACLNAYLECEGLICECDEEDLPESKLSDHGESLGNPCTEASCYHCGWGGTVPKAPAALQTWEKKALAAGWKMPAKRGKELRAKT
jgi:hypothetical protein